MKVFVIVGGLLLVQAPAFAQGFPPIEPSIQAKRTAPNPGTEQALRHQIESLEAGQADYQVMRPQVANWVRYQIKKASNVQPLASQWGPLVSLKFRGAVGIGRDAYEASFEHARVVWVIGYSHGKINFLGFETLPQAAAAPT